MDSSKQNDKLEEELLKKINKIKLNDKQENSLIEVILYLKEQYENFEDDKILKKNIKQIENLLNQ